MDGPLWKKFCMLFDVCCDDKLFLYNTWEIINKTYTGNNYCSGQNLYKNLAY